MNKLLILELISVVLNITFLFLLIKEKKACWIYGILGSLSGAFVVYAQHLYSESILYAFYAVVGVYAWFIWNNKESNSFEIQRIKTSALVLVLLAGISLSLCLGYSMSKTDATKPYLDALSTIFGVFATFLEIYKYYVAWFFWVIINLYSLWLYATSGLHFYAVQMLIYSVLSFYGLWQWNKRLKMS